MVSRKRSPRIALVISQLRAGGAERVVVHLARTYAAMGIDTLVVCMEREGDLANELTSSGVRVVALGSARSYDVSAIVRLRQVIRQFDASVVHLHDYASLPYVAVATLFRSGCRLVFTAHGLLYDGFAKLQTRHRCFSRRLTSIAAVSDEVAVRHRDYLKWSRDIPVIPNGIPDIERSSSVRSELRRELGISDHAFVFLAVGNARPEKAFEVLVGANEIVQSNVKNVECHVLIAGRVGDDDYCRQLRRRVEESSAANLHLLGFRADASRLYSCADAFVVSSRSEGLPLVVLEAMNAGLPIVATSVGGIPGVVSSDFGVLVDANQPAQLADAMQQLLAMSTETREGMARKAREIAVEKYGVRRMAERYLDFYDAPISHS